jgi:hypothetical protein
MAASVLLIAVAIHYVKEIKNSGSRPQDVATKLHFITSPYIISSVYMSDDEVSRIDGTDILFSDDEIVFQDGTCFIDKKSSQTVNALDYFISNYKVLKYPNDTNSSASRTLLPEEVGMNSKDVLINVADCGDNFMKIFNDLENKRIFVEYKNSFFSISRN